MDLFQLTYFIEVAHKKSFTKASKALHISQPSISKGIKALEDHWNVRLFDRKGKNIELTEMGAYLLPKIEELMKNFTRINEEIESPQLLNAGKLTIGVPPMIASSFISPFISHFIKAYPYIQLELVEVGSQDIVSAIDEGLIQAGFVALPITTEMPYDFFIFKQEPLEVVLWPEHPLAQRTALTLEEIKDEPLVYYAKSFTLHTYIRAFYQEIMAHPKTVCDGAFKFGHCAAAKKYLCPHSCRKSRPYSVSRTYYSLDISYDLEKQGLFISSSPHMGTIV